MNAKAATRRAYSILEWKSVDDERRIIEGIASTPSVDRMGDVVEPTGAQYTLPIPFLWQHDSHQPIGHVIAAKATKTGIKITAQIAKNVSAQIDEAWNLIKAGLVRGLSIGFRGLDTEQIPNSWGVLFKTWEWLELSAVTIPANQDASISTVKSIDRKLLAATGRKEARGERVVPPGASGNSDSTIKAKEAKSVKTIQEQIAFYEAQKSGAESAKGKLMAEASEAKRALTKEERDEYDEHDDAIDDCEETLQRLYKQAKRSETAKPVHGKSMEEGKQVRQSVYFKQGPELPKGTKFARYAMAIAAGKGSYSDSIEYAKRWNDTTPEVSQYIKAIAGTAIEGSPAWGSELAFQNNLAAEFVELLRPMTVMGRITGWRTVPFNVRIPTQTDGSTVDWVGEGGVKPVSQLAFSEITLPFNKLAGIVVLSEELVRLSSPSAEETVRRDLTEQIAQFMDEQLLDPTVDVTSSNPASLTKSVTPKTASGLDADALYYDLNLALGDFDTAEINTAGLAIVMPRALARGISTLRNALGQFEFQQLTPEGGRLLGYPTVVSNSCPAGSIILINPSDVLVADDGVVRLDASNQASLDMSNSTTATYSLWQRNMIGIRAERWITYKKRRSAAVAMIDTAAYGPQPDASPA